MKTFFSQAVVALIVWGFWFGFQGIELAFSNLFSHFEIALTMLFGSFVAGSTSVGGGAVAFPVFTKVLSIPSQTALVFSLAIQSVGMTAAAIIIVITRIPINVRVLMWSVISGGFGIFLGLFFLGEYVVGAQAKIVFSLFSFMVALALIVERRRSAKEQEPQEDPSFLFLWISIASFLGGILSGLIGTGIDFVVFVAMIFLLRSGLKEAVATSVCVMAVNAIIGFFLVLFLTDRFVGEVVNYWLAALPIVVVGAPLGAVACRYFHRDVVFYFLLGLIAIDVISTVFILGDNFNAFFISALFFMTVIFCFSYWLKNKQLIKN